MPRKKGTSMQSSMTLERSVKERERRGVGVSTAERVRQAGEDSLDVVGGVQRISQAPLDRLYARGSLATKLDPDQTSANYRRFTAGDRFREDAYTAGMVPSGAMNFEGGERRFGPRYATFMQVKRLDAHARWVEAQAILGRLYPLVDEVCWAAGPGDTLMAIGARVLRMPLDKRAETAALAVLRLGLDTLADHYGM